MDVLWKHRQQQTGEEFLEAARKNQLSTIQFLLDTNTSNIPDLVNYVDRDGLSALHYACLVGNLTLADFLLRNGADSTSVTKEEGQLPLHLLNLYPAATSSEPNAAMDPQLYFQVLMSMLKQDPGITDLPNADGNTSLHCSVKGGIVDTLVMLLKFSRIDVNKLNAKGQTPLHLACTNGNYEIIEVLLEMGADPTLRSPEGSCLEMAMRGGFPQVATLLKNKVAAISHNTSFVASSHRTRSGSLTPRTSDRLSVAIATTLSKEQRFLAQHFNIDSSEKLFGDFACAYERQTNRGRMYITQEHVCFYSKGMVFTSEFKVKIILNEVIGIDKANSAFVPLLDAIRIYTQKTQHYFLALFDRNNAYGLLEQVWTRRQTELARWKRSRARASSLRETLIHGEDVSILSVSPPSDSRPRDAFGFCLDKECIELYRENMEKQRDNARLLEALETTWTTTLLPHLQNFQHPENKDHHERVSNLIRRAGIPFEHRGRAWYLLSGADEKRKSCTKNGNEDYYVNLKGVESVYTSQIDKDIPRTFSDHLFFESEEGRDSLRRVLTAYSIRNPTLGYCQSMNYIAGCLLLFMEEEDAFWVLSKIVEDTLQDYYSRNMIGWCVDNRVFRHLMVQNMPDIFDRLESLDFPFSSITSSWFMCLFITNLPPETTFRIWDCMFFEGLSVIFSVALSIFKMNTQLIMSVSEPYEIIGILKTATKNMFDCDKLFRVTFNEVGTVNAETIAKLRLKYWYRVAHEIDERLTPKEKRPGLSRTKSHNNLDEAELYELYQHFEAAKRNISKVVDGLDPSAFEEVLCKVVPDWRPHTNLIPILFDVYDDDKDGSIGLNEVIRCISVVKKGRVDDKLRLWFKMFDKNSDDLLDSEEFKSMLRALYRFYSEGENDKELEENIKRIDSSLSKRQRVLAASASAPTSLASSPSPISLSSSSSSTYSYSSSSSSTSLSSSSTAVNSSSTSLLPSPSYPTSLPSHGSFSTLNFEQVKKEVKEHGLVMQKLSESESSGDLIFYVPNIVP